MSNDEIPQDVLLRQEAISFAKWVRKEWMYEPTSDYYFRIVADSNYPQRKSIEQLYDLWKEEQ